jgi:hypothetical protein
MHVELCVLLCVLQIVALSDGVMVARGDLGVEMNPWDVPVLQKRIVETCKFLGKPVVSVHFTFSVRVATTRAVCQMAPALTGNLMYRSAGTVCCFVSYLRDLPLLMALTAILFCAGDRDANDGEHDRQPHAHPRGGL